MEGSSNALCEALAQPTPTAPVVATRIGGLVGTLGDDYPGYFPVEDTAALTRLLWRAESDGAFYATLHPAAPEPLPWSSPSASTWPGPPCSPSSPCPHLIVPTLRALAGTAR